LSCKILLAALLVEKNTIKSKRQRGAKTKNNKEKPHQKKEKKRKEKKRKKQRNLEVLASFVSLCRVVLLLA
jgi:hypothetical protein